MNPVPGVRLTRHRMMSADITTPARATSGILPADTDRSDGSVRLAEWLAVEFAPRNASAGAFATDGQGVTVFFDGYLSDVAGGRSGADGDASTILALYRGFGLAFVERLRGSFVCLVFDAVASQAHLFNDRNGSRPVFYRSDADGRLWVGPEVRELVGRGDTSDGVDPTALCEFLIFASYYEDRTLFPAIKKLPQAAILTIEPRSHVITRYWRLSFAPPIGPSSEEAAVEECDFLLRQSINRLMNRCERPFLFLSGGIDSRLLLAALVQEGYNPPVAVYGTNNGDDRHVAKSLARTLGLELHEHAIEGPLLQSQIEEIAMRSDGRAEMVDTPSLSQFVDQLTQEHGSFIQGDKCFEGKVPADRQDALLKVAMFSLKDVSRLADWLRLDTREAVQADLGAILHGLVTGTSQNHPQDIKDVLYAEQRMGNRQNGYTAAWLRSLEQARPWLDEDLVAFFTRLPPELRQGKRILRTVCQRFYPDLAAIEFAKKDSLLHPGDILQGLRSDHGLRNFFEAELLTGFDDRIAPFFQQKKLRRAVQAWLNAAPLPPITLHWTDRIPGAWRFTSSRYENRVHPVSLMLRLLQIQIYLRGCAR